MKCSLSPVFSPNRGRPIKLFSNKITQITFRLKVRFNSKKLISLLSPQTLNWINLSLIYCYQKIKLCNAFV